MGGGGGGGGLEIRVPVSVIPVQSQTLSHCKKGIDSGV